MVQIMSNLKYNFTILLVLILAGLNDCFAGSLSHSNNADSISIIEKIKLGGVDQTIMIHGADASNALLLMIHGGPGFAESYLFRTYNKVLEKNFIVVYWDQRGTGLSYSPDIPPQTMTLSQIVEDAHELVTILKKRYQKEKIYLLGHSWGSGVGITLIQKHPEDFYKYVGVGQIVDMAQNEKLSYQYTLNAATQDKNHEAITELKKIASNYHKDIPDDLNALRIQRKWLDYYGGATYGERNADKIFEDITAKEYALYDQHKSHEAQAFSMKYLWSEVMKINFLKTALQLQVPVYFFTGRHDYNVVSTLVEEYYRALKAPHKEIVWFENSAHFIPFEEPKKFNDMVVEKLLH
jgi:pimeloyl-ACP methyl ester carboxylesterase